MRIKTKLPMSYCIAMRNYYLSQYELIVFSADNGHFQDAADAQTKARILSEALTNLGEADLVKYFKSLDQKLGRLYYTTSGKVARKKYLEFIMKLKRRKTL